MDLRRKHNRHLPYRAVIWFVVATLVVLYYFQEQPWEVQAESGLDAGAELAREASSDVVVVLDYHVIRQSGPRFEQRDFSAAWINLFEQELGPLTIATPQSLSHSELERARVIVLTSSVTRDLSPALLERLHARVSAGSVLVLERPQGALRAAYSGDGRAGERRGQQITFARQLQKPYLDELRQSPLSTDFVGSTAALAGATTWLSIDGAPVIYSKRVGQGAAITIDLDLGEQLVAMQQGKPRADFHVATREAKRQWAKTSDLPMHESMRGASVPYADLLERFIVHGVIAQHTPLPTLWSFPGGAQGVVVAMHEDHTLGDGGGWMLEHEIDRKAVSSLLTTTHAGLTASGAATIHRMGGDIGLLWQREGTPLERRERMGLWGFEPLARPVTLDKQLDALRATLPVNYVRTARISGGYWSMDWAQPFEQLSAQGIRIDMSYETPRVSGYAFGTGLPFLALDASGLPLGVRELPVVVPDHPMEGPSLMALLEASQRGHHMAITVAHAPESFADYPDMEAFDAWLAVFDALDRTGHLMTSAYRFDTFLRSRRASSLQSKIIDGVKIPRSAKPEDAPTPQAEIASSREGKLLRITAESKQQGMWLSVPEALDEHLFATARQRINRIGGELVSTELSSQEGELVGYGLRLIPLERGFNTVDVYYQAPPASAP